MLIGQQAESLHEVPEAIIIDASENSPIKENPFKQLLEAAKFFKHAKCTPIFLANEDGTKFAVSSIETFNRRLH